MLMMMSGYIDVIKKLPRRCFLYLAYMCEYLLLAARCLVLHADNFASGRVYPPAATVKIHVAHPRHRVEPLCGRRLSADINRSLMSPSVCSKCHRRELLQTEPTRWRLQSS